MGSVWRKLPALPKFINFAVIFCLHRNMKVKFNFSKRTFLYIFYGTIAVLFIIKILFPQITKDVKTEKSTNELAVQQKPDSIEIYRVWADSIMAKPHERLAYKYDKNGKPIHHRIYSVPDFVSTFPDSNQTHLETAMRLGVKPVKDRAQAEANKKELVFVASNPYFYVRRLSNSIPYLVPRAAILLEHIGRTFLDSLSIKGIPLNTIMVTSLLRTEDDVARLRKHNGNASPNSCHRYGTTFDIAYNKYRMVQDPALSKVRPVRDDTLKYVLSEVLNDARKQGLCYIKYEKKQGCYHITAR